MLTLALGVNVLVASVGTAASSGVATLERTCVLRISGPVVQALRERAAVRVAPVLQDREVVETEPVIAARVERVAHGTDVLADGWVLDLPPPMLS